MHTKHKNSWLLACIIIMLCASVRLKLVAPTQQKKTETTTGKFAIDALRTYLDNQSIYFVDNISEFDEQTIKNINAEFGKHVVSASQINGNSVCYHMLNGAKINRTGGTIAWRNNNPGCIRYSSKAISMGAIGKANGFAIFPDEETGMHAIETLLKSDAYYNLSIAHAINKYAPPHENNTERYIRTLCRNVGLPRNTKLCDMDDGQLKCVVNTIRSIEGWKIGTECHTPATPRKNKYIDICTFSQNNPTLMWMRNISEKTI